MPSEIVQTLFGLSFESLVQHGGVKMNAQGMPDDPGKRASQQTRSTGNIKRSVFWPGFRDLDDPIQCFWVADGLRLRERYRLARELVEDAVAMIHGVYGTSAAGILGQHDGEERRDNLVI